MVRNVTSTLGCLLWASVLAPVLSSVDRREAFAQAVQQSPASSPGQPDFSWRQTDTSVALLNHGRVVWQQVYDRKIGKPYMRVGLLDGTELTRPWPIPPGYPKSDHTWHRALWWSWKGINGVNYWEEHQEGTDPVNVDVEHHEDGSAKIDATIEYHLPDKPPVVVEKRTIAIGKPDAAGSYLIDWRATFTPAGSEDVVFNRNGYGGLAIRMAAEFSGDAQKGPPAWEFIRSNEPDGTRKGAARWMAYKGTAPNGRPTAVVMFVHPDNPRFPPSWCTRNHYPYLNPCFVGGEDYTLPAGKSLTLRYGVLIHAAVADADKIERAWKRFTGAAGHE
ncbi:MAG: PmoA family protein [Candidatus Nealsonbacteria bacterium]|nr:PmoA family protein [Candidatus Nealsonbacteria bacterium]